MRDGFKRLLLAFMALISVGLGTALLCLEAQSLTKEKSSTNWFTTGGIVLLTDYERTSAGRRTSNAPYVTYSYRAQGESYTSSSHSFGDDLTDREVFERYPSGRSVTVYYNPKHPQETTLMKGVSTKTLAGVRFAQIILGLALAFLAYVTITEVTKHGNSKSHP